MIPVTVITSTISSIMTSWLSEQLPKRGESPEVIERKLRNIVLAILVSVAIGYIVASIYFKRE